MDSGEDGNIGIGYFAGDSVNNASSIDNVFIGDSAGRCGTGVNIGNVAIGADAMAATANSAQTGTIAIGSQALGALTTGGGNVVIGYTAADALTLGGGNIAIGYTAFSAAIEDSGCTAIGFEALKVASNTGTSSATYTNNTAVGYKAGLTINTGTANTIVGSLAGDAITSGANNVAIGTEALGAEDDGAANTAVGYHALKVQDAGSGDNYNTMVGYQAGDGISTGAQNTGIGASVAFDVDANNQTCVGYQATTDSANDIAIGNTSVDEVKGQVDFTTFSDKRIKKKIKDGDLGLDFIKLLKPRKFNKVNPAKYPSSIRKPNDGVDNKGNEFEWTDAQANKVWDGLIAQEVKSAMDACDTTFSGWSEESNSKQLVGYSILVMPLIKAVQELSAEV